MSAPGVPHAIFTARSMSAHNRAEMRAALDHALKLAERSRLTLRVPHELKPVQNKRGMHYHYRPEIFLGLQGTTNFSFPRESFRLGPDELCIDRKSTRLNSSHQIISYAVFCLKKKN